MNPLEYPKIFLNLDVPHHHDKLSLLVFCNPEVAKIAMMVDHAIQLYFFVQKTLSKDDSMFMPEHTSHFL